MTILVDSAVWPWRGRLWAHLISDASLDELHAFAARLALPERSFGGAASELWAPGGERAFVTAHIRESAAAPTAALWFTSEMQSSVGEGSNKTNF